MFSGLLRVNGSVGVGGVMDLLTGTVIYIALVLTVLAFFEIRAMR